MTRYSKFAACNGNSPLVLHPRPPAHKKKHGHGAAVFLFFLAAGVAAFAGMSYRQRTSVLRESLGKGGGLEMDRMSTYENSIYYTAGDANRPGELTRDSTLAGSVAAAPKATATALPVEAKPVEG